MAERLSFYLLLAACVAMFLLDPFAKFAEVNFLPSDVLLILSALSLFFGYRNYDRFMREMWSYCGTGPFWVFVLGSLLGFILTTLRRSVVPKYFLFSAIQLIFCFALLCPLVMVHKRSSLKARKLWAVQLWLIPLAGLLSVTDFFELTNFGQHVGERHYNVILDSTFVNGFWLFALVSPFFLQEMMSFRFTSIVFAALWLLGCAGGILSGTRAAMAVVALSVVFVIWINRRQIVSGRRAIAGLLLVLTVSIWGAFTLLQAFPVLLNRLQQTEEFFGSGQEDYSASLRTDQVRIVMNDLKHKPASWLGSGFKQYRVLHPEDEIESIHNIYLQELYEAGLVGLIAFVWIFKRSFERSAQCYQLAQDRGDTPTAHYWACCLFVIATYLVLGIVYPVGFYRHFWLPLFLATPSLQECANLRRLNTVGQAPAT